LVPVICPGPYSTHTGLPSPTLGFTHGWLHTCLPFHVPLHAPGLQLVGLHWIWIAVWLYTHLDLDLVTHWLVTHGYVAPHLPFGCQLDYVGFGPYPGCPRLVPFALDLRLRLPLYDLRYDLRFALYVPTHIVTPALDSHIPPCPTFARTLPTPHPTYVVTGPVPTHAGYTFALDLDLPRLGVGRIYPTLPAPLWFLYIAPPHGFGSTGSPLVATHTLHTHTHALWLGLPHTHTFTHTHWLRFTYITPHLQFAGCTFGSGSDGWLHTYTHTFAVPGLVGSPCPHCPLHTAGYTRLPLPLVGFTVDCLDPLLLDYVDLI